ncbi:MAG: IPTL-CTERM sorting domain-containing protein [Planctomycetes bacterium]|nr:IPTL-CTERM sorting domain-containing protein [Planctomycetota bacterium]
MSSQSRIAVAMAIVMTASSALAYDVNKDLTNLGPKAYDVAVLLAGSETVTDHYDGYPGGPYQGQFDTFTVEDSGGNTLLHWRGFDDGSDNVINTGQTIHIGWSTEDHFSNILDMWWTDSAGNRIAGSVVLNITCNWTFSAAAQLAQAEWCNIHLGGGSPRTITILHPHYAVFPEAIPLEDLNTQNTALAAALQPFSVSSFDVAYGDCATQDIPGAVPEGSAVVLRYEVEAGGSQAETLDFVQFIAVQPAVPTVSEWGLIVMALLLLTAGAVIVRRRRRLMTTHVAA